MDNDLLGCIDNSFKWLFEKHNFKRVDKINEDQFFLIELRSNEFVVVFESYRREIYCTLSKKNASDSKINLFNLLDYLQKDNGNAAQIYYFNQSYKKQIEYLSDVIFNNFTDISNFFNQDNLEIRFSEIREFIINKNPDLFKRVKKE